MVDNDTIKFVNDVDRPAFLERELREFGENGYR